MEYGHFTKAVRIYIGLNFVRPVETLSHINRILLDWPEHRRSAAYYDAMDACSAAMARTADPEHARKAFEYFAEHTGILADEYGGAFLGANSGYASCPSAI